MVPVEKPPSEKEPPKTPDSKVAIISEKDP